MRWVVGWCLCYEFMGHMGDGRERSLAFFGLDILFLVVGMGGLID